MADFSFVSNFQALFSCVSSLAARWPHVGDIELRCGVFSVARAPLDPLNAFLSTNVTDQNKIHSWFQSVTIQKICHDITNEQSILSFRICWPTSPEQVKLYCVVIRLVWPTLHKCIDDKWLLRQFAIDIDLSNQSNPKWMQLNEQLLCCFIYF